MTNDTTLKIVFCQALLLPSQFHRGTLDHLDISSTLMYSLVLLFLQVGLLANLHPMKPHEHKHFYGTTTIGEKGQVVIPAEARKAMDLKTSDKLLVFGMGKSMVAIAK